MKKIMTLGIVLAVSAIVFNAPVFADGLVFDPDSYPDKVDIAAATTATTPAVVKSPAVNANTRNSEYVYYAPQKSPVTGDNMSVQTRENNNLQNALFELDSAQVDVRNQLLDAKAKYTEIDNQYKLIKEQRKIQKKAVRSGEKRIKQIEKTKENIRKNMQIQ